MTPQTQSRIGKNGRCLNASIASILEIPEHEVPDFPDATYRDAIDEFLEPYGLRYVQRPVSSPAPKGWHLIEGVSPRGGMHAVVGYSGKFRHDPHPVWDDPRRGLVKPIRWGILAPLDVVPVGDRADMARLRKNTEQQGGPFFIQETTKSGAERTIPVRELAKGADSKASEVVLLLAAIYAWYKSRKEAEAPVAYDLTKYVPRRRVFDSSINSYHMSDILDALGIDIKEYMRRTEAQKKALLKTALEKLEPK